MRTSPSKLVATQHLQLARCPHGNVAEPSIDRQANLHAVPQRDSRGDSAALQWGIYVCKSCAGVIAAATDANSSSSNVIWLVPQVATLDASLPSKIQHFLTQARETLHSPSASIMMSASSVDAMLKELDYKKGPLYDRIQLAAKEGKFTADMATWAHDVRLDANDERHADEMAALPTIADATRALDFADTLAEILFVLPARVRRGLKKPSP